MTHKEGVKVGPPPHAQAVLDYPVVLWVHKVLLLLGRRFALLPFVEFGHAELFVESREEAFCVGLGGVEVSAGTGECQRGSRIRVYYQRRLMRRTGLSYYARTESSSQFVERIGDLERKDMRYAVVLSFVSLLPGNMTEQLTSTTMMASTDRLIPVSAYWPWSRETRVGTDVSSSGWNSRSLRAQGQQKKRGEKEHAEYSSWGLTRRHSWTRGSCVDGQPVAFPMKQAEGGWRGSKARRAGFREDSKRWMLRRPREGVIRR